ncbi:EAL domain-containing protein [Gloeocapsopsis sp. IPPAS B-1203]|uniref:putative bifunctional diguanylate cyclase/phosphodiesterase n=1 Tax=Gloeocapsopsis sp. IPPAS B-1203 TaxID=2049454 RepID=UPI000C1821F4|nr:EAL domain-containing protein [Gloeocapsopsis sp. IPPAS B-1203]PIG91448.1 GGDEF-domain containing protein [Gloeocapsopsis sp. IPPAS B-1203]
MSIIAKLRHPSLQLYSFLSRFSLLKSYKGKIMIVAFVGTHIPLLSLLIYFISTTSFPFQLKLRIIIIALLATLIGTALTLYALHNLLAPISLTFLGLRKYLLYKQLPNLPTEFTDEAGILMADTVHTIKKLDQVIDYMASYDDLTGLPNRDLFRDRLQQAVSQAHDSHQTLAVMFLSLNRLKRINDTLGYHAGDVLLRSAAQRFTNCINDNNILARVGSNTFAIVQTRFRTVDDIVNLAEKICDTVAKPFAIDNHEITTGASVGIAIYPSDTTNIDHLVGYADTAMHQAQRQELNNYHFYSTDLNSSLQERLALENELYYALDRGELLLHYQPQVSLHSGRIIGVETLIRWQNPARGLVSPAKFIPIAEETGLIVPIGEWVLRTACAQSLTWQAQGFPSLKIAVNLSARQFKQQNLVQTVNQVLETTGLDPHYLELELTESLMIDNIQQSINIMQQLHNMGIVLSVDDFGTGYSSLNYLKRFPIHTLKIDQSFVRDLVVDSDDAAIVDAIISLAHSLNLSVIAEGVESQEQLTYLQNKGCDEIQGYYFSRPLPAHTFTQLLEEGKALNNITLLDVT